ncbi:MAG: Rrf2 family transcriptional regulator [Deltaproteobacteria bacterium]|nr:Rrf2 family transcriptional regulator [Deltaproteobacteria bacterium]
MKITFKGDYALKAILYLAFHYGQERVVPIVEIADENDIPRKFLEQIMQILKGAGIVDSKRGISGGFFLKRAPDKILLGEIVRLIEGDIEPIPCAKNPPQVCCDDLAACAFKEIWVKVAAAVSDIIDNVTFADIMERQLKLKEADQGYTYQI